MECTYGRPGIQLPFLRRTSTPVVHDISFTIDTQETLALVGESGSRKTTIARAVAGLLVPSRGWVRFEGQDVTTSVEKRSKDFTVRFNSSFRIPLRR